MTADEILSAIRAWLVDHGVPTTELNGARIERETNTGGEFFSCTPLRVVIEYEVESLPGGLETPSE